jgi:hypothetical protein
MTKSTPTLTQSGLLAVLLQYQRYKVFQLARRRAQRKRVRAAFWSALTRAWRALTDQSSSTISPSPLWEPEGARPSYESRLVERLYNLRGRESNEAIATTHHALKLQGKDLWDIF